MHEGQVITTWKLFAARQTGVLFTKTMSSLVCNTNTIFAQPSLSFRSSKGTITIYHNWQKGPQRGGKLWFIDIVMVSVPLAE